MSLFEQFVPNAKPSQLNSEVKQALGPTWNVLGSEGGATVHFEGTPTVGQTTTLAQVIARHVPDNTEENERSVIEARVRTMIQAKRDWVALTNAQKSALIEVHNDALIWMARKAFGMTENGV